MNQTPDVVVVGFQELDQANIFSKVGSFLSFKGDQGNKLEAWSKNLTKAMNEANKIRGVIAKED